MMSDSLPLESSSCVGSESGNTSFEQPQNVIKSKDYFVNWDEGTSGKVVRGELRNVNDFAIRITTLVEAGELTGYYCQVKRELDGEERTCFFTSDAANQTASKFAGQLNKSFGAGGGFMCGLSDTDVSRFIQFLKRDSEQPINICRGVSVVGQQRCKKVWVLNADTHVDERGQLLVESSYLWTPECIALQCKQVSLSELVPEPITHLSTEPLHELVNHLEVNLKHNFLSGLLMVGGGIMYCHYNVVAEKHGGCPIVIAIGPTETGKSTSILLILSMFGLSAKSFYVDGSNAYFLERSSLSYLPYGVDDVGGDNKQLNLPALVVSLFGGAMSANCRQGALAPHSLPLLATNYGIKDHPRIKSRSIQIPFYGPKVGPRSREDRKNRKAMDAAIKSNKYACLIGWIISLGRSFCDAEADLEVILTKIEDLPGFEDKQRACNGWAILVYFTIQVLKEINREDLLESLYQHVDKCVSQSPNDIGREFSRSTSGQMHDYGSTIQDTAADLLKACESLSDLRKILPVIRTGTHIGTEEVVAVDLADSRVKQHLSHPVDDIKQAISGSGAGNPSIARDFLDPKKTAGVSISRKLGERKRVATIFLSKLPTDFQDKLKQATGTRTKGQDPVDTSGSNATDDNIMGDSSNFAHSEVASDTSMKESSLSKGLPTQASLSNVEDDTVSSDNGDSPMDEGNESANDKSKTISGTNEIGMKSNDKSNTASDSDNEIVFSSLSKKRQRKRKLPESIAGTSKEKREC